MRRVYNGDAGPDCSPRAAYLYLALFAPAITVVVLSNWRWNGIVNDTLLLVSSLDMLERFSSLFSNANSNPLQALFDIFPSGLRLDTIPNIIWQSMFGPGMNVDFFYACCGALLAVATAAMARTVGLRWGVAIVAGILFPLLVLPTFGLFPLIEHFYILWPITYYSTAGTLLVTALFWRIDGRSWRRSAVLTGVIVLVLLHLSMIQIMFMTLLAPALVAMGVGALAASKARRDVYAKLVCAVVIVAALAAAGIFSYLYAIGVDTARYVFYRELMDFMNFGPPDWHVIRDDFGYVFLNPFTFTYRQDAVIDGALAPLAQLGAIYLAIFGGTRNARVFGRTVLVWVVATGAVIAFLHNFYYYTGHVYQGPDPRHFVPILWPYYVICLASLIFAMVEGVLAVLARAWPAAQRAAKLIPHSLVALVLVGPVVYLAVNDLMTAIAPDRMLPTAFFSTYLPYFHSYRRNPIVDYLDGAVGAAVDRDFRGSVLSLPTDYDGDTEPYAAWHRETTFAYARAYLGNDLGAFGLRYYNIPTLDEETHNLTPQFYLTVRELLSRPGIDSYDKHYALVTRLNEPIMELLGLRYIIADYELPFGTQRISWPIPDEARKVLQQNHVYESPVYVYELPHPNIGDYSPTQVLHATTAREIIQAMAGRAFDGRQTVVTDDPSIGGDLVPATEAAMTVRMGGVALRASSTGQSVLVLPVQYSHCWRVTSGDGATLFRANLTQLGVRFSGDLRLELRQIFGPFWRSACRVRDHRDAERLDLVGAVGTVALPKTTNDSDNLIRRPEALHRLVGNSIASIRALDDPNSPVRAYGLAAEGAPGEHYVIITVPTLTPGPYTLSLQVRDGTASHMTLQIRDGTNGALANYFTTAQSVSMSRLGQGDALNATIRKRDDGWFQLTLTSTIAGSSGQVIVQLEDEHGNTGFAPNGEVAVLRAIKLQRGEAVTPYAGLDR